MATLNTKSRANFEKWLKKANDHDLKMFTFANATEEVNFESEDFMLVYNDISDGEPADCHMIEARVSRKTKDKQLKKLFLKSSTSLGRDLTLLAFALVPTGIKEYCMGKDVRQALELSPIEGKTAVNKVHIQWSPSVTWDGGKPTPQTGSGLFAFEKIPFQGYNLDGTRGSKKKQGKK